MEDSLEQKLERFIPCAEQVPGVVEVHQVMPKSLRFETIFINQRGQKELGIQDDKCPESDKRKRQRFFNNADIEGMNRKLKSLLKTRDPQASFSFFQQVRPRAGDDWIWHIGSVRIFHQDHTGIPTHVVTVTFPVDRMRHIPTKAERLLAESDFYRENLEKFAELGDRAREVLRLVALGKSSGEIAASMDISVETVNTHRKRIKKKLGISTSYEFTRFAMAFDLM